MTHPLALAREPLRPTAAPTKMVAGHSRSIYLEHKLGERTCQPCPLGRESTAYVR